MKQIGIQVLAKIENLLAEINRQGRQKVQKKVNKKIRQQWNGGVDNNGGTSQKLVKTNKYNKLSYGYLNTRCELYKKRQDRVYEEQKQFDKFKIRNKKTKDILSRVSILPIHQRVGDILQKKQQFINQIKLNRQKQLIESMVPDKIKKVETSKKFNQQQFQQYIQQIDQKNKQRIYKIHLNQIQKIKREEKFIKIPEINSISRSLSCKRQLSKNYSQNVYKRMEEYTLQRQIQKDLALKKRIQLQGGFKPSICPYSQKIMKQIDRNSKIFTNTHIIKCQSGGALHSSFSCPKSKSNSKCLNSMSNKSVLNRSAIVKKSLTNKQKVNNISDFNMKYSPLKNETKKTKSIKNYTILIENDQNIQTTKKGKKLQQKQDILKRQQYKKQDIVKRQQLKQKQDNVKIYEQKYIKKVNPFKATVKK